MNGVDDERAATLRWGVYLVLIAIAVGNMSGRLLAVNSVDKAALEISRRGKEKLQRPFLSANDRSRWLTMRALVERGTYEIDSLVVEPTWDTIDMVQHRGADGELHLYSSKPPLLATILAGEYWLVHQATGWTLGENPYEVGRLMLFTINILPLVLMYFLLARLVERFGTTDWGRIFVMAVATLGTFLTTFAVVLNNHIVAAVSAAIALFAFVRIYADGERRWWYFAIAGLAAAFTAADELPALAFLAGVGLLLFLKDARLSLAAFVPAALVVVAAFFATNYLAHGTFEPPYAHRSQSNPEDDWYSYTYTVNGVERQSYWLDRQGIDVGEESKLTYALHALVGHHGIFSLTPVWLLSLWGVLLWARSDETAERDLALLVGALSLVVFIFYIGFRPQEDRNYGGMTSGLRWMFWFAPLWLVMMLPAADRLARSTGGMVLAAALLTLSCLSVSYPTWNPWTHPWIYRWMEWCGWQGF
jgi:MFS family permease